jgi:hypothetical protein
MAGQLKSIEQQVHVMRRLWPQLNLIKQTSDFAAWEGPLVGIERAHIVQIMMGLPREGEDLMFRRFPMVRVVSPALVPNWAAPEEAPLPHVFFDHEDLPMSPLCLFDVEKDEWSHRDFLARTTVPWTADWLACYEGWQATGYWYGGGRHGGGATP